MQYPPEHEDVRMPDYLFCKVNKLCWFLKLYELACNVSYSPPKILWSRRHCVSNLMCSRFRLSACRNSVEFPCIPSQNISQSHRAFNESADRTGGLKAAGGQRVLRRSTCTSLQFDPVRANVDR
ncbi:hypothetical protein M404DRAFT_997036 [Pisolithus tinctorius Marx 270]|uniref:Uncharacterized protein n=1 Tax=Pisolithus tinctorius Marx 270 TaxID=870435 RepID=A0A0C3KGZ1_PISTI|nr:hypothetical protein M404DRAFT_997036 [Pisolithus tinctorius Marx 270]